MPPHRRANNVQPPPIARSFFPIRPCSTYFCAACLCVPAAALAQPDFGAASAPPSLPAPGDTLLPTTGLDPTISDLREHLLQSYGDEAPTKAPPQPNLQINGSIGLSEEFTDNAGGAAGTSQNGSSDYITSFNPSLSLIDTSPRLQANLLYSPSFQLYAVNRKYSQIAEYFQGSTLTTLLPGWLYLDSRASIIQRAVFGGFGPLSTTALAPGNRETITSLSASPYITRSLGSAGTAQIGGSYSYTNTQAPNFDAVPLYPGAPASLAQSLYGSSWLGTLRGFANYTTGEDLGRLRNEIGTDVSSFTGNGASRGGSRDLLSDDASYAVTRLVSIISEGGYEWLRYPSSHYSYIGPLGSGGLKLTPSQGSSLTVEYRYIDGFGAAYVQGDDQISPRIRLFGGYSEGISTFQQDQQNTLADTANLATGANATGLQAAPLLQNANFFSSNQDLARVSRLSASATYLGNWDTITFSLQRQQSTPLPQALMGARSFTTGGTYGVISDRHDLTPTLNLSGLVQYGANRIGPGAHESGDMAGFSVTLTKTLSDKVSAYLRLSGYYAISGNPYAALVAQQLSGNQTTAVVGVSKGF